GASHSVPIAELVREVNRVAAAGFKEVILTGVHLGYFGRDLSPSASLLCLLRGLEAIDADAAFRISSLEPMDCTPAIVAFVASSARFMPHFPLPLQHARERTRAA